MLCSEVLLIVLSASAQTVMITNMQIDIVVKELDSVNKTVDYYRISASLLI